MGIIYNAPFAIFHLSLEPGDTFTTLTTQYMSDFNREISTLASEHNGCSTGRIVYVDYEGAVKLLVTTTMLCMSIWLSVFLEILQLLWMKCQNRI